MWYARRVLIWAIRAGHDYLYERWLLAECPLRFGLERFTKSQVVRAGKTIIAVNPVATLEVREAFAVANAWRDAHVLPMRLMRRELSKFTRKIDAEGVTVARLKRLQSLRRKIKRGNRTLYQVQDIAGCRAIVQSMAAADALTKLYHDGMSRHDVIDAEDDYIAQPKADGYRSRHLVLRFTGPEKYSGGNRLVVEVQLRTRLQHAWATAVEAVGMVRNENLKGGVGDPDWLRLFQLMSAELAAIEGCPLPMTVPSSPAERQTELRQLDSKLGAIKALESYNRAIRHAEQFVRGLKGHFFIIKYGLETQKVEVTPVANFNRGAMGYWGHSLAETENAVLVEVDKVDELRQAYPNYFLDVFMFTDRLKEAVYEESPRTGRYQRWGDLSWLRNVRL